VRDLLRLLVLRARTRGRVAGRDVRIGRGVRVEAARGARVVLERGVELGAGSRIHARGDVVMRAGARLGERAVIVCGSRVEIGAGAVVGDWAVVSDVLPSFRRVEVPVRSQPVRVTRVVIGPGARWGPHAAVSASVRPGAVVEPYAVV
jgi:acetyltransferase-like isoleucine patch superfamily enzyme